MHGSAATGHDRAELPRLGMAIINQHSVVFRNAGLERGSGGWRASHQWRCHERGDHRGRVLQELPSVGHDATVIVMR
jgi:hypothetical protein